MQKRIKNSIFFIGFAMGVLVICLLLFWKTRQPVDDRVIQTSATAELSFSETDDSESLQPQTVSAPAVESVTPPEKKKLPAVSSQKSVSSQSSASAAEKYVATVTFDDIEQQLENQSFSEKLAILKRYFPNGKYWNHAGYDISGLTQSQYCTIVTSVACHHRKGYASTCNHYIGASKKFYRYSDNYQCLGFASMISDLLYGKNAPIRKITDYNAIKPGDEIRFVKAAHSVVVLAKSANGVTVLECNYRESGCKIAWGRTIPKSYFDRCGKYFALTRR